MSEQNLVKPLPCPFCGYPHVQVSSDGEGGFDIMCLMCYRAHVNEPTPAHALAAWNNRHFPALDATTEATEKVLDATRAELRRAREALDRIKALAVMEPECPSCDSTLEVARGALDAGTEPVVDGVLRGEQYE